MEEQIEFQMKYGEAYFHDVKDTFNPESTVEHPDSGPSYKIYTSTVKATAYVEEEGHVIRIKTKADFEFATWGGSVPMPRSCLSDCLARHVRGGLDFLVDDAVYGFVCSYIPPRYNANVNLAAMPN